MKAGGENGRRIQFYICEATERQDYLDVKGEGMENNQRIQQVEHGGRRVESTGEGWKREREEAAIAS